LKIEKLKVKYRLVRDLNREKQGMVAGAQQQSLDLHGFA
jgi:hypothetical protein